MNYYHKEKENSILSTTVSYIRKFCLKTSIHGFNHIAAPRRHWIERLLWVFVTAVAVWGVVDISLGQWQRYNENPTVVTLEKDYRTWTYNLPAVTACEKDRVRSEKLPNAIKSRWNVTPSDTKYDYYKRFVRTVANSDLYNLKGYEEFGDDQSLNIDLYELVIEVMPEHRVKTGTSESVPIIWTPVMTESGVCYTFNSIAISDVAITKPDGNNSDVPITCKYSSQICFIILESAHFITFYANSPYEIANIMLFPSTIYPSMNRFTELATTETRAGSGVRELQPRTRHCLFTDEPTKTSSKVYSTNSCRQDCRGRLSMELCGCRPFYYFYDGGPSCTVAGMKCLSAHAHRLATFNGVKCPCAQKCIDSVFRPVSNEDQIWEKGPFLKRGALRFTVRAPRTRYTRYIVFHLQDLVVSFGGATGLFLGASFISFVEILYFIFEFILPRRSEDVPVLVKKPNAPYEARINELNYILEDL